MKKVIMLLAIFICTAQSFAQIIVSQNKYEQTLEFVSLSQIMTEAEIKNSTNEIGVVVVDSIKSAVLRTGKYFFIEEDRINKLTVLVTFYPAPGNKVLLIGEKTKYIATQKNTNGRLTYQYGDAGGLETTKKNDMIILVSK